MSFQLPNHLIANRKRLALSQQDVAFLLGLKTKQAVCRYERFVHQPSLETALAFEAIFKRSISEMFPGLYQKIERDIADRAKALMSDARKRKSNHSSRRSALADMAAQFQS